MPVKRPAKSAEQIQTGGVATISNEESIHQISQLQVFFAAMFLKTGLMRQCKSQIFLTVRSSSAQKKYK